MTGAIPIPDARELAAIALLKDRGYVVRHKSEARRVFSWHRTAPMPHDVNFRVEAVEKIRAQIAAPDLEFSERPGDGEFMPTIHSAFLRVLT